MVPGQEATEISAWLTSGETLHNKKAELVGGIQILRVLASGRKLRVATTPQPSLVCHLSHLVTLPTR